MIVKKMWASMGLNDEPRYHYIGYLLFGFIPIYIERLGVDYGDK